jgi:hypothetical protein
MKTWLSCLIVLCTAAPAQAFICARTSSDSAGNANGPAQAWNSRQLTYAVNQAGTGQLPFAQVTEIFKNAFAVWETLQLDPNLVAQCGALPKTDLKITALPPTAQDWIGYNWIDRQSNLNLLTFRDAAWNHATTTGDIIALTTTTFSGATGEIFDADIEFNSATFTFSAAAIPPSTSTDLLNTAVHEIGHFLGLAHCGTVSCGHAEVMEPTADGGEISKRRLKCDDRAGIVFKYPAGQANGFCSADRIAAGCGFCAPPQPVRLPPTLSTLGLGTQRGGTNCAASADPTSQLMGCLLLLGGRFRRRIGFGVRLVFNLATGKGRAGTNGYDSGGRLLQVCRTLVLVGLSSSALRCAEPDCGGQRVQLDAHAPMIAGLRLVPGPPSDPWQLILALDFIAYDGNLGGGSVQLFANGAATPTAVLPIEPLFAASGGIPKNATSGTFALTRRVETSTPDGAQLQLAAQLVNSAGQVSNCYTVKVEFRLF